MSVRTTTMMLTETLVRRQTLVCAAGVVGLAAASAVAAQVRILLPFSPVPITLQTMVVLLAGATLGPWAGAGSQALYLGLGALGLPIFAAAGAGLAGPTAGYLVAFPLAAWLVGRAARRGSVLWLGAGMLAATVVIQALGTVWLALATGQGLLAAALVGCVPFIPGDLIKLTAALSLARTARAAYRKAGSE